MCPFCSSSGVTSCVGIFSRDATLQLSVSVVSECRFGRHTWLQVVQQWSRAVWTHRGSNPGPSACGADVIPLHHVPLDMLTPLCQIRGPAAAATATETLLQRATAPRPHSKRLANENNKCQAYRSRSFHKKRAHMCGFSICAALRKR